MASIKEKIKNALRMYNRATRVKTLQTMEEIEANTESNCLAGAGAVAELNNKLAQVVEYITPDHANAISPLSTDKISGKFSYTAPKNGILYVNISQTLRTPIYMYINDNPISSIAYTGAQNGNPIYWPLTFILAKGDKFEVSCSSANQVLYFTKFVPFVRG